MKRFLKIEVSSEKVATVYVVVDDARVKLEKSHLARHFGNDRVKITDQLRKAAQIAADDIQDNEWDDLGISSGPFIEVSEEEAMAHQAVDLSGCAFEEVQAPAQAPASAAPTGLEHSEKDSA